MDTRDFTKEQKGLYLPKAEPVIVDVPEMLFLMVDGKGAPDSDEGSEEHKSQFQEAIGALYGMIYSIKMSPRKDDAPDGYYNFKVPPPEALWWMQDGGQFDTAKPDDWGWTLMMRVPEYVTQEVVDHFTEILVAKKQDESFRNVRLEKHREGLSVQLMHIGSYVSEGPNIIRMHKFATDQGYQLHGKHHEIYYGDPRRSAPEKLRTVIRQPIAK